MPKERHDRRHACASVLGIGHFAILPDPVPFRTDITIEQAATDIVSFIFVGHDSTVADPYLLTWLRHVLRIARWS